MPWFEGIAVRRESSYDDGCQHCVFPRADDYFTDIVEQDMDLVSNANAVAGVGKPFRLGQAESRNMLREAIFDALKSTCKRREPSAERSLWAR